ncbi:MAG: hypothetical protein P4L96_22110 [Rhodoferax sp.]|nr:hypothetical protein [Rhodoferax sp.]
MMNYEKAFAAGADIADRQEGMAAFLDKRKPALAHRGSSRDESCQCP